MKKRLKIFLSSTVKDLSPEREIAARAIEELHLEAVRAETFGAHPGTPSDVCMEMVRNCDVFIGIYGGRYGFVPQGQSVSATELEFLEARRKGKDILVYIKDAVDREPLQVNFLKKADDFEGGYFRRPAFRTITELEEWIKEDLIALLSSRFITQNPPPAKNAKDAYKAYVIALYRNLSFSGVAQTESGLEIPLVEIFINPIVQSVSQNISGSIKPLNVNDLLINYQHVIIVGSPGIGKTVLLKKLAVEAAQGIRVVPSLVCPYLFMI
jgi:Cdc6-like AAA superfamily ATPase